VSLRAAEIAPVPAATVQVAKTAFPKGCPAMRMRDELGAIYDDQMFCSGLPGPWPAGASTVAPATNAAPHHSRLDKKFAPMHGRLPPN